MTGFDSKRKMALAKLDDNGDTQVDAAVLTIVYQRGFADGKRAAQRKPLTLNAMTAIEEKVYLQTTHKGKPSFEYAQSLIRATEAAHGIKE
jgi:hypothetical protein